MSCLCVFMHVCLSSACVGELANLHRLSEGSLASAGWQVDMQHRCDVMPFPSRQKPFPRPLTQACTYSTQSSSIFPRAPGVWPTETCAWLSSMSLDFQVLSEALLLLPWRRPQRGEVERLVEKPCQYHKGIPEGGVQMVCFRQKAQNVLCKSFCDTVLPRLEPSLHHCIDHSGCSSAWWGVKNPFNWIAPYNT